MGGTLDNKVAQTLARAFTDAACEAWRMNFRGVGESEGEHAAGNGETDDMVQLVGLIAARYPGLPLFLAGFSFGGYVQARVAARLAQTPAGPQALRLMLVAPAVQRFDVPQVPADTLLIHGELDDVIPLAHLLDWARPQELPVLLIPSADHFFHRRLAVIRHAVAAAARDSLAEFAASRRT
ncbi:MAG: alpha/beta hydrolase [Pseudomonadota bacterium]|nr:alpha/beta hydrolase [Pseudomonadota bacterium]